ncbi:MAG: hypothetical protein HFH87_01355 [Lachnospiraceae bacterium]|nr:hypothetical protein [Lachnospiraceae bacterium]
MDNEHMFAQIRLKPYSTVKSDEQLKNDDRFRMTERNGKYSELLEAYTTNTKRSLLIKVSFRIIFLLVSIGVLVGTFVVFCVTIWCILTNKVEAAYIETIVSILSVMVSMVTVFIVLPKIMTKYLFDIEEEKNMYNVVKQIQDYDQVIRENLK